MEVFKRVACLFLFPIIFLFPYYAEATRGIAIRPISPAGKEVKGDQWLFVIGIDKYTSWPRLKTAVNDAKAVKDVLLSRYHFDKKHFIELYDETATRKNIIGKFRYLARKMRDSDSLVIFYAGHGHIDSITKSGSWIPVESGESEASAWISNHDIKNYLKIDAMKAKHILLISDSCFSGDFFRGRRGKPPGVTDEVIKRAYELTSRQAITSGGLEPVADEGFGKNSVFSHFLVRTLKENQKPFLVPSDFFPDIRAGVAENAEQFPRLGSLTGTGGQQGGELVLFLKQDARLEALSEQASERKKELERLQQMEASAEKARKKEAVEIARREKDLAELDAKIEAMRKRLGGPAVKTDESLDAMLAMVQQKEAQERRLEELRRQREKEERKRQAEIARLKREREEKVIATLAPEVEKYKKIVASKYGQSMKSEAWKSLIAKCPPGWADGVNPGDIENILMSPEVRKHVSEKKREEEKKRLAKLREERIRADDRRKFYDELVERIALVQAISRADVVALFVHQLRLDEVYFSWKSRDTTFSAKQPPATDIADHVLRYDIETVIRIRIRGLELYPDHTFQTDKKITRADFAMMLSDILIKHTGVDDLATRFIGSVSPFPDLRNDLPYFNAVMICTTRGVMVAKDLATGEFDARGPVSGADALQAIRILKEQYWE